jgi:hypothetical protein
MDKRRIKEKQIIFIIFLGGKTFSEFVILGYASTKRLRTPDVKKIFEVT